MSDRSRSRSRSRSKEKGRSGSKEKGRSGSKDKGKSGSEEEKEEIYEVEEIRDKRRGEDDDWLYYVKWVGWDSDTNTWEPREHLAEDCKEKLDEFERRWKKRQERKEEKRADEKKKRKEERRQRELKAAARFSLKHDSDGEGVDYQRAIEKSKERKTRVASESESDGSDGERERKRREEREERKKRLGAKTGLDRILEKKDRGEKEPPKDRADKKKPRYFRDIRPVKILGVTTEPGELHFYVEWDSGMEPGLVSKKEAYKKIPDMCLAYYESKLIWRDKPVAEKVAEVANGLGGVAIGEKVEDKAEEKEEKEEKEEVKTSVVENGAAAAAPALHSYS